jgi:glycosyltransferase involved in cell wall biosynthesis
MKCHICTSTSNLFSKYQILGKYDITYYQCTECGFVQTESPYWLDDAYSEAIADSDIGLVYRNLNLSLLTERVISNHFDGDSSFLDYGGGYGLFVRLMRDKGFDFYWEDKFCQNIFARNFILDSSIKYELVTAFEVFEHLSDPLMEIEAMLQFSDSVLFSTELLPASNPRPGEWWYYAPQTGQHISFYTYSSLQKIAERLGLKFYSDGSSNHLLSKRELTNDVFKSLPHTAPRKSLLFQDAAQLLTIDHNSQTERKSSQTSISISKKIETKIVIDGVFFQLYQTGISRVWKTLLEEWSKTGFSENIIVLDRSNTAPQIPGIRYRQIPAFDVNNLAGDRQMLQDICDEEGADVFTSTYYTTPVSTPTMLMIYDMIPEVMGWNLEEPAWRGKVQAIEQASAYASISENSAQDLLRFYPSTNSSQVTVTYCGVSSKFTPAPPAEIQAFQFKYGIQKPYFLITGGHGSYKNTVLFFQAFSQLINSGTFDIVCTSDIPDGYRQFTQGSTVHHLRLNDEGLRLAYAGAVALIYPSKYEGFGLPIVEALACGCPVITCPTSSIPEVAKDAALYVQDQDVNGMVDALCEIQKPSVRQTLINKGLVQAQQFSWAKMAQQVGDILASFPSDSLSSLSLQERNLLMFPDWSIDEELLSEELASAIGQIIQTPDLDSTALLVDVSNAKSLEQVELILAGVSMNLLMEQDLDISEHLAISPVGMLSIEHWQELLPRINNLISLPHQTDTTKLQLVTAGLQLPVELGVLEPVTMI